MTDKTEKGERPELVKTKWGYYQFSPLPTDEELSEYYTEKYYQSGKGSYSVSYTNEEVEYFRLKARLVYRQSRRLTPKAVGGAVLDIGCGSGIPTMELARSASLILLANLSKANWSISMPMISP